MSRRICVTNIGFRISEDDVRAYFQRFGQINECRLQLDRRTGESRGFAFVSFATEDATQRCLSLTSHRILDKAVSIASDDQYSESSSFKIPRSKKVFVSCPGMENVTELSLLQTFQPYGEVTSVEIVKSKSTNETIYCLVYFRSHESVDICVSRAHCVSGRQVFVRRAVSREEIKLAEQRERELTAAKEQAKKVYGVHMPTRNVTVVQPRLFASMPSMLSTPSAPPPATNPGYPRKRTYDQAYAEAKHQSSSYNYAGADVPRRPVNESKGSLEGYGYI